MKCFARGPQDIADARQAFKTTDQPINIESAEANHATLRTPRRRHPRTNPQLVQGLSPGL